MNVVKDLPNLIKLLNANEMFVIFPIGSEGQSFMDFLRYTNFLRRVGCIASMLSNCDEATDQNFYYSVPIIPFENLITLRETAIFVVAGPEEYYSNLNEQLKKYGAETVIFIPSHVHTDIKGALQRMESSGQIMTWFLHHFDRKISHLEYLINWQNELTAVNTKAFEEYKNAFHGKEIVLFASGFTAQYYKPISNAIHIGVNFSWHREDIPLDFLFVVDMGNRLTSYIEDLSHGVKKIKEKVFIAKKFNSYGAHYKPSEIHSFFGDNVVRFFSGGTGYGDTFIFQDIRFHSLMEYWSVTFSALNFALFTYPKKIYLVGCDVATTGHFYDNAQPAIKNSTAYYNRLKIGYARIKMFANLHYPDTEIVSINPVGLRGLFRDVYTDEYKAALNNQNNAFEKQ